MRGSSQPSTRFSFTSCSSLRLLVMAYVRCRRANSYWCGSGAGSAPASRRWSSTQSYSGRLFSNSSVHSECVMFSSASEMQCVKSYIG